MFQACRTAGKLWELAKADLEINSSLDALPHGAKTIQNDSGIVWFVLQYSAVRNNDHAGSTQGWSLEFLFITCMDNCNSSHLQTPPHLEHRPLDQSQMLGLCP